VVYINEWLANPKGADAAGEWIELFNSSPVAVDLSGLRVQTKNGKQFALSGTIHGNGYLVLPRSATKLTLRNNDEAVLLYNAEGRLIDQSHFLGEVPEGKSVNRVMVGDEEKIRISNPVFRLGEPTPGTFNKPEELALISDSYVPNIPLHPPLGILGFAEVLLGSSVALTALILYATKQSDTLSYLFFGRD